MSALSFSGGLGWEQHGENRTAVSGLYYRNASFGGFGWKQHRKISLATAMTGHGTPIVVVLGDRIYRPRTVQVKGVWYLYF